jgi:hypothetical protein
VSRLPWFVGGAIAAYAWTVATAPHVKSPIRPSGGTPTTAPRNARHRKDHPDLVSVTAHARAWPGTSIRAR